MANPQIEKLLILQDRDQVVRRLVDQLASIPCEVEAHEAEIEGEKTALENSKSKLQGLEVQRNDLDLQVRSAQEKINKYRNQQLEVKKNEEYQALAHEIELTEKQILVWEEEEIALMLEIDGESEVYSKREAVFDSAIAGIREKIAVLGAKKSEIEAQLDVAKEKLEESKTPIEVRFIKTYERLADRIKLPVIVPVKGQICEGCHLRVSNDTVEESRKGEELTTCDNCGRVVFLAS
jgi:uncharacterized protein